VLKHNWRYIWNINIYEWCRSSIEENERWKYFNGWAFTLVNVISYLKYTQVKGARGGPVG
jgi:hypothetical protein